jgi:hypothetical protein
MDYTKSKQWINFPKKGGGYARELFGSNFVRPFWKGRIGLSKAAGNSSPASRKICGRDGVLIQAKAKAKALPIVLPATRKILLSLLYPPVASLPYN